MSLGLFPVSFVNRVLVVIVMGTAVGCGGDSGRDADDQPEAGQLVRAAGHGDVSRVRSLLAAGADVDERDGSGRTAVTAAAMAEHVDLVRMLVDAGADIDLQDEDRNNPLLLCGENGNVELLREVLRANPNLHATNRFRGTALIPASDRGHVDMVRALLETDVPIDHVNRLGWTALLEAVVLGDGGPAHQRIVRLLVDAGADTSIADRDGVTALEHARERGYDEIARILDRA
jgi:uncharacterized protein